MTRLPIVAAAVAILVVVIGGGLFLSRSNGPAQISGPSPTPMASSSGCDGDAGRLGGSRDPGRARVHVGGRTPDGRGLRAE